MKFLKKLFGNTPVEADTGSRSGAGGRMTYTDANGRYYYEHGSKIYLKEGELAPAETQHCAFCSCRSESSMLKTVDHNQVATAAAKGFLPARLPETTKRHCVHEGFPIAFYWNNHIVKRAGKEWRVCRACFDELNHFDPASAASLPAQTFDGEWLHLKCEGCGSQLTLGRNAIVSTLESARTLFASTVVVSDDCSPRLDLVLPSSHHTPAQSLEEARTIARWKIVPSLQSGQTRKWECQACKHQNSYPKV